MTSQLIDSLIFVTVAFAGVLEIGALVSVLLGQYVVKLGIAVVDTPIVYLLVSACRPVDAGEAEGERYES